MGELWAKKKKKEDDSHWPNPDCSGLIAAEGVFWLSRLVAEEIVGQSSVVSYGLFIVHLYSQSLTTEEQIDLVYNFRADYIHVALRVLSRF